MREFKNKLHWDLILHSQDLSKEFMEEFADYIHNARRWS